MAALNPRLRLALAVAIALLLAALVALLVSRSQSKAPANGPAAAQGPHSPFKGSQRPVVAASNFSLDDQDGDRVTLKGMRGRVVVLTFMYTTCRDACPIEAQSIRGALDLRGQSAKQVSAVAISVDPRQDTPRSAKAFLLKNRASGRIDYLLGSRAQLASVWRAYAVQPQTKHFDHSAYVLLIDRRGRQRTSFPVGYLTPEDLAHDVRILLREPA